jgi:hypothetical protein
LTVYIKKKEMVTRALTPAPFLHTLLQSRLFIVCGVFVTIDKTFYGCQGSYMHKGNECLVISILNLYKLKFHYHVLY